MPPRPRRPEGGCRRPLLTRTALTQVSGKPILPAPAPARGDASQPAASLDAPIRDSDSDASVELDRSGRPASDRVVTNHERKAGEGLRGAFFNGLLVPAIRVAAATLARGRRFDAGCADMAAPVLVVPLPAVSSDPVSSTPPASAPGRAGGAGCARPRPRIRRRPDPRAPACPRGARPIRRASPRRRPRSPRPRVRRCRSCRSAAHLVPDLLVGLAVALRAEVATPQERVVAALVAALVEPRLDPAAPLDRPGRSGLAVRSAAPRPALAPRPCVPSFAPSRVSAQLPSARGKPAHRRYPRIIGRRAGSAAAGRARGREARPADSDGTSGRAPRRRGPRGTRCSGSRLTK